MDRRQFTLFAASAGALALPATLLAAAPETWDNLVRVPSRKLSFVYLLPGADFRAYHKVMLDTPEVAFARNWQRDYNNTQRNLSRRINASDIEQALSNTQQMASTAFAQAFGAGGYPVVNAPGEDVLRVRVGVVNIRISAPAKLAAGRTTTFSGQAGSATLVLEARDSVTDALLGRAVDSQVAGDTSIMMVRSTGGNRADFQRLLNDWARRSVAGLDELRALSPVRA